MVKRVLLITAEPRHRVLYERGLSCHFTVRFLQAPEEGGEEVDAVVYDIPTHHSSKDLEWLESVNKPVVVLTPEDELPLPTGTNRCMLTYPVSMDRILQALAQLGVESREEQP